MTQTTIHNKPVSILINILEDIKAEEISVLNVSKKTIETDIMIIVTGTSNRHIKGILKQVKEKVKPLKALKIFSIEGEDSEWILVDFQNIILHIMYKKIREFYQLEKLWS